MKTCKPLLIKAGIALLGLFAAISPATAQLTNGGFEAGNFTGWSTTNNSGVVGTTAISVNNGIWTIVPAGSYQAEIDPELNLVMSTAEANLGLPSGALNSFNSGLFNASTTNFGTLTQNVTLSANQSITMYWNFVARDYDPYNDGVFATLVGSSYQSIKMLAVTTNAFGTGAMVTGDYGSTGWHSVTFTAPTAGTYRLGFAAFNYLDQLLDPALFVDDPPGSTSNPGTAVVLTTSTSATGCTTASASADVTNGGGSPVTARGFVWNTAGFPTLADNSVASGTGAGTFSGTLTGLTPGITYFVRSYATNGSGTTYGAQMSVNTDNTAPTISGCPGNIVVNTCGQTATATWTPPTATDNCGTVTSTSSHQSGATFSAGITTVSYIFSDAGGNSDTCLFTVTVNPGSGSGADTMKPVIVSFPGNDTVYTSPGDTTCSQVAYWTLPTATDNCGSVTITGNHQPGDTFQVGSTQVLYSFRDAANNVRYSWFYVVVIDSTPPVLTTPCPADVTVYTTASVCLTNATWVEPAAMDYCDLVSTHHTHYNGGYFQRGTTPVTYTFSDSRNNYATCSFNVIVKDTIKPVVSCKNFTLTLSGGMGIITPGMIEAGSYDACGIVSKVVSPSTITCAQAGSTIPVTLTVTDASGNSASCTSMVTVQHKPVCSIVVTPTKTTYTGGVPTNIYLGYGAQSARMTASVTGGTGFTYSWSPSTNLSATNISNPIFTPTAAGNYTYTVTVTNSNGCSSTCTVTFCVKDIRQPGTNKFYVCHGGTTTAIPLSQVAGHINSHAGDYLGQCDETCGSLAAARMVGGSNPVSGEGVRIYPNPNNGSFVVELPYVGESAQVTVTDVQGRLIQRKEVTGAEGNKLSFDLGAVAKGVYLVDVVNGDQRVRTKLVIQ